MVRKFAVPGALLLSFVALEIAGAKPASAAGQADANTDIAGFRLSMSQSEAKAYAAKAYPGAHIVDFLIDMQRDTRTQRVNAGFEFEKDNGDTLERIRVSFNPDKSASDIFAISRFVTFSSKTPMVKKTLVDSLFAKYGEPINSKGRPGEREYTFLWSGPELPQLREPPGSLNNCLSGATSDATDAISRGAISFFYEQAPQAPVQQNLSGDAPRNLMRVLHIMEQGRRNNSKIGATLSEFDYSRCGTVFIVRAFAPDSWDHQTNYFSAMSQTIINLTKGTAEISAFGEAFFKAGDDATTQRIEGESTNKPKL
jgi:hypothetical protein